MIKRLLSLLLAVSMLTALFVSPAQAAGSEEEALGEVDIYNSGTSRTYLSIHGRIQDLNYTYYNYVSPTGTVREIPAYCVNPNTAGVPQAVGPGESVAYIASGITSDPKTMGIVASGYPTHGLRELNLQDKYEAFYATKIALWCYLIPSWNIADLRINPACGDTDAARRVLTAAQNIYTQGTAWTRTQAPRLTSTVDRATAYPVTVDGKAYRQQIITIQSDTWVCEETISVRFADPDDVPEGTRLVDMDNRDVTEIPTERLGNGYGGRLKILFPADDEGGGHVQLNFSANVYRYAVYYAICAEKDQYGNIQNYVVDTDPTTPIQLSTYCDGGNSGEENENTPDTGLKITKLEAGTETPLAGALFEVIDPEGATVGTFSTRRAP